MFISQDHSSSVTLNQCAGTHSQQTWNIFHDKCKANRFPTQIPLPSRYQYTNYSCIIVTKGEIQFSSWYRRIQPIALFHPAWRGEHGRQKTIGKEEGPLIREIKEPKVYFLQLGARPVKRAPADVDLASMILQSSHNIPSLVSKGSWASHISICLSLIRISNSQKPNIKSQSSKSPESEDKNPSCDLLAHNQKGTYFQALMVQ